MPQIFLAKKGREVGATKSGGEFKVTKYNRHILNLDLDLDLNLALLSYGRTRLRSRSRLRK
jgi:hypothetical protein